MRILLDCRPLLADYRSEPEKDHIIISTVQALADNQGVEWLLLVDGSYQEDRLPGIRGFNIFHQRALPGVTGWKAWYDWQLPRAVKRYKADLLMTTGGTCCIGLNKPQCTWMPATADPEEWTEKKSYGRIYRKRMIRSLQESGAVFTFSGVDKAWISARLDEGEGGNKSYAASPGPAVSPAHDKIIFVPGEADARYVPIPSDEREKIKETWSQGKEYFLTIVRDARPAGLIDLLKAFSAFKKRQRSNIQLVLVQAGDGPGIGFPEGRIDTYRYRLDVHIYDQFPPEELPRLVAGSYGLVAPFRGEKTGLFLLNAWAAGVPVITTVAGSSPEMAEGRVLFALPGDHASLAGQLMSLYKDESLRSNLIGKGLEHLRRSDGEGSASRVWNGIQAAVRDFPKSTIKS